jgi:hypothetical protein
MEGTRIKLQVKMDWHDSMEAGSKKVVYYCTTLLSEFDSTLAVYWNRV